MASEEVSIHRLLQSIFPIQKPLTGDGQTKIGLSSNTLYYIHRNYNSPVSESVVVLVSIKSSWSHKRNYPQAHSCCGGVPKECHEIYKTTIKFKCEALPHPTVFSGNVRVSCPFPTSFGIGKEHSLVVCHESLLGSMINPYDLYCDNCGVFIWPGLEPGQI